jgi:NAD(P)H dehydrogenase (quinone)
MNIAEILALLLLENGHANKVYELNGPEALSRSEIVTQATGRRTIALPVSGEEFGEFMREQGRPPFVVEMVKGLHAAIDAGEFATVWPDAAQLLGRPAQSSREYLRKAFERT